MSCNNYIVHNPPYTSARDVLTLQEAKQVGGSLFSGKLERAAEPRRALVNRAALSFRQCCGDKEAAAPAPPAAAADETQAAPMQEHYRQTGGARLSKLLLAGAAAGAVSRTATAPIDRLKMLLQVQDDCKRGLTLREGIAKMSAEGSVKSYFRGNGANVLKIAPETAIKLALNDQLKLAIAHNSDNIQPLERMVAGGLAGAVAQVGIQGNHVRACFVYPHPSPATAQPLTHPLPMPMPTPTPMHIPQLITPDLVYLVSPCCLPLLWQFLLYPLDTIRTRLAVSSRGTYTGIMHVAARIRADEGLAAFYRGLTPSMIGILPYAGVDIALFEILKQTLFERAEAEERPPPHFTLLVAGMVSSSIAQVVSYPLALIRTRLQAQGGAGKPVKYSGMMDVVQKTLAKEGVQGLYKGLVPNILKLAPAAGLSWWVFEETKLALGMDPRS
ncbi:hypothetical protein QJQ45_005343 [Haematococcus lacustris]|nr:hypothetical protein QJQ45_005343 [Haematococcus lacustris]